MDEFVRALSQGYLKPISPESERARARLLSHKRFPNSEETRNLVSDYLIRYPFDILFLKGRVPLEIIYEFLIYHDIYTLDSFIRYAKYFGPVEFRVDPDFPGNTLVFEKEEWLRTFRVSQRRLGEVERALSPYQNEQILDTIGSYMRFTGKLRQFGFDIPSDADEEYVSNLVHAIGKADKLIHRFN